MTKEPRAEGTVIVYEAGSWTEAVVLRGLLESAGISSPPPTTTDPYPMKIPPEGIHGVEIIVPAAQADDARRIIDEYRSGAAGIETQGELPKEGT